MTGEREDLEATYRTYARTAGARWTPTNRGNQAIHEERNAAFAAALQEAADGRPIRRLLEVGCGDGRLLEELAAFRVLEGGSTVGVDLLGFRLLEGRAGGIASPLVQAGGQRLPFPDASFDVVVLSTVFSSIGDDALAHAVAGDIDRVLAPGGSVVWYDMRLPNPGNRKVRRLRRTAVTSLFPGYGAHLRSITLLPPLARRLGGAADRLYGPLARVPVLRSHLVGTLRKPA